MGTATLSVDQTKILNHKSDAHHADNDWLNLVVAVNNNLVLNQTSQLVNPKFAGQSQLNIFGDGDIANPWGFSVPCADTDTVIASYSIINLSSYDWDQQVSAAGQFTQKIADVVVPIYLQAAAAVLGLVASGGLDAPAIIQQIAEGSDGLLNQLGSAIGGLVDSAFQNVIIPGLADIADFVQKLLTGRPDCNGLVLRDYVIFLPNQPANLLHIEKTYEGVQTNSSCGEPPHTFLDINMRRKFDNVIHGPFHRPSKEKVPLGR